MRRWAILGWTFYWDKTSSAFADILKHRSLCFFTETRRRLWGGRLPGVDRHYRLSIFSIPAYLSPSGLPDCAHWWYAPVCCTFYWDARYAAFTLARCIPATITADTFTVSGRVGSAPLIHGPRRGNTSCISTHLPAPRGTTPHRTTLTRLPYYHYTHLLHPTYHRDTYRMPVPGMDSPVPNGYAGQRDICGPTTVGCSHG